MVAIVVAFCMFLLFLFVPETFWDRTPIPRSHRPSRRPSFLRRTSSMRSGIPKIKVHTPKLETPAEPSDSPSEKASREEVEVAPDNDGLDMPASPMSTHSRHHHHHHHKDLHVGFAPAGSVHPASLLYVWRHWHWV